MTETTRILLAEDEEIIAIIIADLLTAQGYSVDVCADGEAAWKKLRAPGVDYDAILLDRAMPRMDGMALLRLIKAEPALTHTPVIIETAQSDQASIHEGLAQGAYYYLTKPFQTDILLAVVEAAVEQTRQRRSLLMGIRQAEASMTFMTQASFRIKRLDEGRTLASFLAHACPDPERTIQGLQELLVNAVEHGNLGISYAEKSALLLGGGWLEEVERRAGLPEYRERQVAVGFERNNCEVSFVIEDQGDGFDWTDYLDFSPERAFDLHGRGIAMASKLSFDRLVYEGRGNRVTASLICRSQTAGANP
jgi:DNA-binding response OmpR family regulator